MENRLLKFKRAHFDSKGKFIGFTEWGFLPEGGFFAPSCMSNEEKHRAIDCQFLGLMDINKVELYEGHIMNYSQMFPEDDVQNFQIRIGLYGPELRYKGHKTWLRFAEWNTQNASVVGNIFENTELLTK